MSQALIFTGHRVDAPDRAKPRFPPSLVDAAGGAISRAIDGLAPIDAIASASRGGDILFLEACRARSIPTTIVLPFSPDEFERRSVAGVGPGDWVARYRALIAATPPERLIVLDPTTNLTLMAPAILRFSKTLKRRHPLHCFCSRFGTAREAMAPAAPQTWSSAYERWADG